MPSVRLLALALLVTPLACGSSSSDDSDNGGSSGSGGGYTKLEPAPNIDVTTCASIHTIEDNATSHCSTCCATVDADASSFINDGACTCALPKEPDPGKTVCTSAAATAESCGACCTDNGYLLYGWVGEDELTHTGATCGCGLLQDNTVCKGAAGSEGACTNCCMHEGFIGYGFGSGTCSCTGG